MAEGSYRRPAGGQVSPLPLDGIRVLDLSRLLPGPFCSLLLVDYGADVIKMEDTGVGDYVRWSAPAVAGAEDSAKAVRFLALNRNKASMRLDLKDPAGARKALAHARRSAAAGLPDAGTAGGSFLS